MTEKEELDIYGPFEETDVQKIQRQELENSKKTVNDEFDLEETDIFIDESSPMLNHLNKVDEPLIGMEMIVDDQTHDNLKCILCRVILRDRYAIIEHLKDVKHQSLYMERFHPVVYNCLVERRESVERFCELINQYSVELAKEQGRKRCRTYIKGCRKTLPKPKPEPPTKHDDRRSSKSKKESASTSHKRKSRSRSRSRSRSPHRKDSSRSHNHHHHRQYRHRHASSEDDKHSPSSVKKPEVSAVSAKTEEKKPEEKEEEDIYGELPVDQEITNVLFAAKLAEFASHEKSFVHNEMALGKRPVVGLDFVAEYPDPWNAYQPGYLCVICDARFSPSQILNHVASERHRLKYMERRYKTYYATVSLKTLPEETRKDLIQRYSRDIEIQEGRGFIKRKILINDTDRFIFRHHKPLSAPVTIARKRISRDPDPASHLPFDASKIDVIDRRSVPLPPKLPMAYNRPPTAQRPNFVYSEKVEKAKQIAEIEKLLPPFVEKNLESGWYSVRQFSMDYYQRLVPPLTPYISVRCPRATHEIYGSWSPYVMRRIQDQFNFSLDHLTWLQKLLLDWRIPLSKPLDEHELRPLADDVESAVLKSLVGQTLQPNNFVEKIHSRVVFEYDDRPTGAPIPKRVFQTIEYQTEDETKDAVSAKEEAEPQKFTLERRPSNGSVSSSNLTASASNPPVRTQSVLLTPTPSEDDQKSTTSSKRTTSNEKAVAERAMLALIDQVLQTAKDSKISNPVLNLILSFHNARSILFALATKQPATLQQLVVVMKNPSLVVPPEVLAQLEKKLRDIAADIEL